MSFPKIHNGNAADEQFYCSEYAAWALYVPVKLLFETDGRIASAGQPAVLDMNFGGTANAGGFFMPLNLY